MEAKRLNERNFYFTTHRINKTFVEAVAVTCCFAIVVDTTSIAPVSGIGKLKLAQWLTVCWCGYFENTTFQGSGGGLKKGNLIHSTCDNNMNFSRNIPFRHSYPDWLSTYCTHSYGKAERGLFKVIPIAWIALEQSFFLLDASKLCLVV